MKQHESLSYKFTMSRKCPYNTEWETIALHFTTVAAGLSTKKEKYIIKINFLWAIP